ncbi:unnamed protein product [Eruca vesicaria subsp. sativa]|uniref:RING-type E3 ubiquitin transferase n=1 Tax=Eruca vesicaria subsp. sativa TaxID=29727 RepID=A0ABC8KHJ4_ERUVS|nr:unnamed protein product [Eruca vesicaria subsp. sativa]
MASTTTTTTVPATELFTSLTIPITLVLTCTLLFVIVAGFISLLFWKCFLNRLFSAWTRQRTPYNDLIHVTTPPENTGLDPFIIKSYPVFPYSSAKIKNQVTECSICLSEFTDQDTVRVITVCRHGFHTSCIDLWFESHKTCPVCRCELDPGLVGSASHDESVRITIQDLNHDEETLPSASSSKRVMEGSPWRFSRSHSTGRFKVRNVKIKRRSHCQTGSSSFMFDENPVPGKRVREISAWRFTRSYSTGQFMRKPREACVNFKGSCVSFDELTQYIDPEKYIMAW